MRQSRHAGYGGLSRSAMSTLLSTCSLASFCDTHTHIHTFCQRGQWKQTRSFLHQWVSGSGRRKMRKGELKEGQSGLCLCLFVCVFVCIKGSKKEEERHNDRWGGQWNVAIPRTPHWGWFIDHAVEGTYAVTCNIVEANYNLTLLQFSSALIDSGTKFFVSA